MSDAQGWSIGQYDEPPPKFDYQKYTTLDELLAFTAGLLDSKTHDMAWFDFEADVRAAMKTLDDLNNDFAKKKDDIAGRMKGEAATAFTGWANDLLAKSRELHDRVNAKSFYDAFANIGHTMAWFYNNWWDTVGKEEEKFVAGSKKVKEAAQAAAQLAADGKDLDEIIDKTKNALEELKDDQKKQLVDALQYCFANLSEQYIQSGRALSTLSPAGGYDYEKSDGEGGKGDGKGDDKGKGDGEGKGKGGKSDDDHDYKGDNKYEDSSGGAADQQEKDGVHDSGQQVKNAAAIPGAEGGSAGGGQALKDQMKKAAGDAIDGVKSPGDSPETSAALDKAKQAAQDAIDGAGGGAGDGSGSATGGGTGGAGDGSGSATGSGTGGAAGGAQGLDDQTKKAAGDAIDGVKSPGDSPETSAALDKAKQAAQNAIGDIGSGAGAGSGDSGGGTGGAPIPTEGGPGNAKSGSGNKSLEDAKKAAKDAIEGVKGNYQDDPKSQEALDQAENAVGKAIGDLDPENAKELGDAKDNALKAIDDVKDYQQDPAVKDALEKAKQAVGDAVNEVKPGEEGLKHAHEAADKAIDDAMKDADPKTRAALDEAKKAVDKSFDNAQAEHDSGPGDVKHKSLAAIDKIEGEHKDSPAVHDALEKAKEAVGKAVDPGDGRSPSPGDARPAADQALDDLIKDTADPDAKHALEEAKKAIGDVLPDASQTSASHDQHLLDDSKSAANKAFDDVLKDADPGARKALEDARDAVGKSIDGIGTSDAGGEDTSKPGSQLNDFLSGSGSTGGGGGGPSKDFSTSSEGPGGGQRAQFDTDVAGERGYTQPGSTAAKAPAAFTAASGGQALGAQQAMPMGGGMPMGGMGGMGGMSGAGGQNHQREPQIWLQADKNAWTDDPDGEDEPVLGRKK
ncbi:hypothetical protein [Amycolatopsis sp. PS_44_ISF1]|uniref:hypothetical protein n=1 Tax=Amycolatopsis sp. PS_44_ISF1 TaxID=2974917 RepID=UPI0028DE7FCA|nr:hypothetical protein [Amycolatopsis sp. PS_44_ISF1]MDT8912074.1 hypothetical protein [Amycolatopsis sp. PS_44_ISF1]